MIVDGACVYLYFKVWWVFGWQEEELVYCGSSRGLHQVEAWFL